MTTRRTILVVDDEPLSCDLLVRLLGRAHEVIPAADAEAALATLAARPVDLVISDHVMPGRTGVELAREIRLAHPAVPVLLLTGLDDAIEVEASRRDGTVFEIVAKPWHAPALRATVARALEERDRRRQA